MRGTALGRADAGLTELTYSSETSSEHIKAKHNVRKVVLSRKTKPGKSKERAATNLDQAVREKYFEETAFRQRPERSKRANPTKT